MAFISNEKREGLIKNVNQSYTWRKILVLVEIVLLIAFIVLVFLSWEKAHDDPNSAWAWINNDNKLTTLGISMLIAACVITVLAVVTVVLIFTLRSPKSIKKDIKTLEGSALSGQRIKKNESAADVMRARRNPVNAKSKAQRQYEAEQAKKAKKAKKKK